MLKGYSQNDFDKPILSNYTVSPSSVDISSGTQTLTLNITASDASGVVTPTSDSSYRYYFNSNIIMVQLGPLLVVTVIMEFTSHSFTLDSSSVPSGNYSIAERVYGIQGS